jgi:hypothetical protein
MLAIVLGRITQGIDRPGPEKGHPRWWQAGPVGVVARLIGKAR